MDWVHCNFCYIQPGEKDGRKFSITSCGHIYCASCLQSGQLEVCYVCQTTFTSIPLTRQMSEDVEPYFLDPIPILKKQGSVLEFQQNHRMRLIKFYKSKISKFDALTEENKSLKRELARCKEQLHHFKKRFAKLGRSSDSRNYALSQTQENVHSLSRSSHLSDEFNLSLGHDDQRLKQYSHEYSQNKFNKDETRGSSQLFTPPLPPKSSAYRYNKLISSNSSSNLINTPGSLPSSSPITPESLRREIQSNSLQRTVKLPGDKRSPMTSYSMHRLSLQVPRATSTPNSAHSSKTVNKYSKYF